MTQKHYQLAWPSTYVLSLFLLFSTFSMASLTGFYYLGICGAIISAFFITEINVYKQYIAFLVVVILCFQNFIIGFFGNIGNQFQNLIYLTQVPFIFLFFIYIFLILKKKLKPSGMTLPITLLLLSVLVALARGGEISDIILQLRNLTTFYFAFEVGRYSLDSPIIAQRFVRSFVILSYVMLAGGIVFLIGDFTFYRLVGIANVYFAKGLPNEGVLSMPGRFSTDIFNIHVERMGSFYYEPVTLSYFFAAATIASYVVEWSKSHLMRIVTSIIMAIGILLTGGKGGMLILSSFILSIVLFKFFTYKSFRLTKKVSFWLSTIIAFIIVGIFSNFYGQEYAGPAAAHFNTIEQTWQTILQNPFGHGLAQGGFNQSGATMTEMENTGAESALMSFGYQLGVQGLIALFICFDVMTRIILKASINGKHAVIAFLPFTLFGVSLFQLNTYTPQAIVPFMLIIGSVAINLKGIPYDT